jgi:NDP-sugar pyrophosphorylase family protein
MENIRITYGKNKEDKMKDLTLVVMAAGMGSRFGGPKQITEIGPSGEFIIDYSIYDAIRAGFNKIVFVIRKEHEQIFKNTIEKRVNGRIKIEYAYQEINNLPIDSNVPKDRTKPLGTAHAILCAKELVNGPFAIINADDFYGYDAYKKVANYLKESDNMHEGVMISYPFIKTSSNFGSVKRGVIELSEDKKYVTGITECSIEIKETLAHCTNLNTKEEFDMELTHPVSMNLFGFQKNFMDMLEIDFKEFIHNDKEVLKDKEVFLPDTVKKNIANGNLLLRNIVSESVWAGLTYKEDMEDLENKIHTLIENGEYPNNLWED